MTNPTDMPDAAKTLRAAVFTIPIGQPFLRCLARAILAGDLPRAGGPKPTHLDLGDITLYMPTRRAARALSDAFLIEAGQKTMLLPAIRPISEGDETAALLADTATGTSSGTLGGDLPPAIDELARRLTLAKLVLAWTRSMADGNMNPSQHANAAGRIIDDPALLRTPAQAVHLAAGLASLMDMVETENVSLAALADIPGDRFAEHWQKTVTFLDIITTAWPGFLEAQGLLNPADRRNQVILAEAARLKHTPPRGPVIVAGLTGSVPATAELMRAVLALEAGAIVLPALDLSLDDDSFAAVHHRLTTSQSVNPPHNTAAHPQHPEHPQFGLARLLERLGLERNAVVTLPGSDPNADQAQRQMFISEMMRPSHTTSQWRGWTETVDRDAMAAALEPLSLITAPSAQDEAEVIALILREAIEHPTKTAALVSPDRLLARRVATRLEAWGLRVDDSAGRPFAKTVPGTFLNLVLATVEGSFRPADVMALLKHPLTRLGLDPFKARTAARALELIAFRTAYFGRGIAGLGAAVAQAQTARANNDRQPRAVRRLFDDDWIAAEDLVMRFEAAFAPLVAAFENPSAVALADLVRAHLTTAEALAADPPPPETSDDAVDLFSDTMPYEPPTSRIYEGEAGNATALLFAKLLTPDSTWPVLTATDFPDVYRSLIQTVAVRERIPPHPRLSIWGPFEARLQQPDIVILGGLNDSVWPGTADPGPWLNRPMRAALGLPSPEEALGYSAHDFTTLLGADRVYLTRAEKADGVPTVPSRWLMRMTALLDGLELTAALATEQPWLAWAKNRDARTDGPRLEAPSPCPKVDARPKQLSVTAIETWIANPYAIFAGRILKLEKLKALGASPGPELRGTVLHASLARFAEAYPRALPDDIASNFLSEAEHIIAAYTGDTRVAAFWVPRMARFAALFAQTEPARRKNLIQTFAEEDGAFEFDTSGQPFTVTARADRIDHHHNADGTEALHIIDYKTSAAPNSQDLMTGRKPQLPLEAIIVRHRGFASVPEAPVDGLSYITASGKDEGGRHHTFDKLDIAAAADTAFVGLQQLVTAYARLETPYTAKRRPKFSYDYDDFAHLARVAEWSGTDQDSEGDA